ncbi:phosphopyruvate hydratase [Halomarina pelagica]|uniref:phosphopyruvate hydratase n=1 Tax=Halomarina pelagica TaxID=2961599 RepID=UPI0020C4D841|nr:phosphopyruvate hydratase [Halomarina sp. BND7]
MSATVTGVDAWEVLDSRGDPTVRVAVDVEGGRGVFTVPAGASTGAHEVVERRDGGERYGGKGVTAAVEAVRETLAPVVVGMDATDQRAIDAALVERDGTGDLTNLGGNAVLGVSGGVAHAVADARDEPLYRTLADGDPGAIPRPMVNVLSGGLHARGGIEIQDFLVVPTGAETYPEALETAWSVRDAVRERIEADGERPLVADEGGYAPPLADVDDAFELLASCVRDAGHEPSRDDVAFAVDVAATHFYDERDGSYALSALDRPLDREGMIDLVAGWTERYPVVSVEDPLADDDWEGWARLADRLSGVQLLGDDLLATDAARIRRAAASGAANAALVKLNQAGTVTRTLDAVEAARDAGFATVVSARSGETCDATIADLAVAVDGGQIKIGSLARSERLAKYNRLLEIDRALDAPLSADPAP